MKKIINGKKYDTDTAKKWAEKHLTCDEYESCFGEVDE